MRMLQWFKRNPTPLPREQLAEAENQTLPSTEKLERLVGRLGTVTSSASEGKLERLVHPLETVASRADKRAAASTQMRVIVVASQKGGVGKTTVAAHLAVQASMVGQGPAVLIDTDPQGSLSEWWDARKDEYQRNEDALALATTKLDDLPARLAELQRNGAAVAIIDTPPAITSSGN
jgi:Mrp family chromosome partitioning ATPase